MVRDTVSSVGFGRGGDCLSASSAATHACHIRHALALDEYRVKFMPEYFFEMNSPDLRSEKPDDRDDTTTSKVQPAVVSAIPSTHYSYGGHPDPKTAVIKEVWFAGSHSDVYVDVGLIVLYSACSRCSQGWQGSSRKRIPRRKNFAHVDASRSLYERATLEASVGSLDRQRHKLGSDQFNVFPLATGRDFSSYTPDFVSGCREKCLEVKYHLEQTYVFNGSLDFTFSSLVVSFLDKRYMVLFDSQTHIYPQQHLEMGSETHWRPRDPYLQRMATSGRKVSLNT